MSSGWDPPSELWGAISRDLLAPDGNATDDFSQLFARLSALSTRLDHSLGSSESDFLSSALYRPEILAKFTSWISRKESVDVHVAFCELLSDFQPQRKKKIVTDDEEKEVISALKKYSLGLAVSAPSSRSRVSGLRLLESTLLSLESGNKDDLESWAESLQIDNMVTTFQKMISQGVSKHTASVIRSINIVLGVVCKIFSSHVSTYHG